MTKFKFHSEFVAAFVQIDWGNLDLGTSTTDGATDNPDIVLEEVCYSILKFIVNLPYFTYINLLVLL